MNILFIDTVHPFLEEKLLENNMVCHHAEDKTAAEIDQIIHEYDGLILRSRIKINQERLSKAKNLKFIARAGSGLENIDTDYCDRIGITYFNAPEANCKAVAEHALGMILSLFNKLNTADNEMRNGIWKREENRGLELGHRTVGIIGYGHNGKAFGNLLKPFGCKILAYDKYVPVKDDQVQEVGLAEIFGSCDVVSFHVPLTEETHYYFDDEFMASVNQPFYLINTSRGKVVETKSVLNGLTSGKILGACLDVLEYEKTSFETLVNAENNPDLTELLNSDKVILSPHVAGWTQESLVKLSEVLAFKILNWYQ